MDSLDSQSSRPSSSSGSMVSLEKDEIAKLVHVRDELETQVKFFQRLLVNPTENANILLNTIDGAVKKSRKGLNRTVNNNLVGTVQSTATSSPPQFGGLGQHRKFNDTVKTPINTVTTVEDIKQDKNLVLTLSNSTEVTNELIKLNLMFDALALQLTTFDYILATQNPDSNDIKNVIPFVKMIKLLISNGQEQSKKSFNTDSQRQMTDEDAPSKFERLKEKKNLILKQVELFSLLDKENSTLSLILQMTKFIVDGMQDQISCVSEEMFSPKLNNNNIKSQGMSVIDIVQRSPLENDLILKEILKNVKPSTLLDLRRINSQWSKNVLTFRFDKFRLSFQYDFIYKSFIRIDSGCSPSTSSLKLLNECLFKSKTSSIFPISKYEFYFGDLNLSEAFNFFKEHGELIKELKLVLRNVHANPMTNLKKILKTSPIKLLQLLKSQNRKPYTSSKTLRKILLDFTPNLQTLMLISTPEEWEEKEKMNEDDKKIFKNQLFPEPRGEIQLKSIRTIKLGETSCHINAQVVKDILQAAVNVKCIEEFDINFWECCASIETKKRIASAIKIFELKPTQENLVIHEDFVKYSPEFQSLKIDLDKVRNSTHLYPQLTVIIKKLFESSKNTLERLYKMRPLTFLPELENIPIMEKVKFLDLWNFRPSKKNEIPSKILPRGLKLSNVFPSLEKVSICTFFIEHWNSYFDFSETVPRVKDLLVSVHSIDDLLKVAQVFPNVEKLMLIIDSRIIRSMCLLWHVFGNLKSLGLMIFKNTHLPLSSLTTGLGTTITGITKKKYQELLTNSRDVQMEEMDSLRQLPWIGDAPGLRKMAICTFLDKDVKEPVTKFSPVTKIFGIQAAEKKNGCKIQVEHKTFVQNGSSNCVDEGVKWTIKFLDE